MAPFFLWEVIWKKYLYSSWDQLFVWHFAYPGGGVHGGVFRLGVGIVIVNLGSSKAHEKNPALHHSYLYWWGLQKCCSLLSHFLLSRIKWSTSRLFLATLASYTCYSPLWAAGVMGGAGLRSPGRKERWCICNDACHQQSVFSIKLPSIPEILWTTEILI